MVLLSSAEVAGGAAEAAVGPAPAPTAPVPPLLPLAQEENPLPPGPSEMFSESTGRYNSKVKEHFTLPLQLYIIITHFMIHHFLT